jgi:hypothetical protein
MAWLLADVASLEVSESRDAIGHALLHGVVSCFYITNARIIQERSRVSRIGSRPSRMGSFPRSVLAPSLATSSPRRRYRATHRQIG